MSAGEMAQYAALAAGDPAPVFRQRTHSNPNYAFDMAAGRYIVLCFYATAADDHARAAITAVAARRELFNDSRVSFFGVSHDQHDLGQSRIEERIPGIRHFLDFDGRVGRLYGSLPIDAADRVGGVEARRLWAVLDPALHIRAIIPFEADRSDIAALLALVEALPPINAFPGIEISAPIIALANVFDTAFCQRLVALYEAHGGAESGFMREIDGKTVGVTDFSHKRRRDYNIEDNAIIAHSQKLVQRRIIPEILKVHQFKVTRMERYIVACYDAAEKAHFRPHRDNTTSGTAHRRFAVSINLNDDFEGGEISFPEYGPRSYKPPIGGAVVFSCSLLHMVSPVTRGRRFAFLPFLYDEAAAALRERNNARLGENVAAYSSGQ